MIADCEGSRGLSNPDRSASWVHLRRAQAAMPGSKPRDGEPAMRLNGTRLAALGRMSGRAACSAIAGALLAAGAPAAAHGRPSAAYDGGGDRCGRPADWRTLDPANTVYLQLAAGRVVDRARSRFCAAARGEHQDADPGRLLRRFGPNPLAGQLRCPVGGRGREAAARSARSSVPPEFTVPRRGAAIHAATGRRRLCSGGRVLGGFPAARDPRTGEAWLVHCYAMVGADAPTRSTAAQARSSTWSPVMRRDSSIATSHWSAASCRASELLSVLPRGTGALGFYEQPSQRVPIVAVRMAADVPPTERANIEIMRTDTPIFAALVEARRNRQDEVVQGAGRIHRRLQRADPGPRALSWQGSDGQVLAQALPAGRAGGCRRHPVPFAGASHR